MSSHASSGALSEKEAEVYDRQIRLWGVEAQRRMRSARVLVIGMGALGAEVVKNLTLAGINVAMHDEHVVSGADLCHFFLSEGDVGQRRALACLARVREMNPHVSVDVVTQPLAELTDEALRAFSLVINCKCGAVAEQVCVAPFI